MLITRIHNGWSSFKMKIRGCCRAEKKRVAVAFSVAFGKFQMPFCVWQMQNLLIINSIFITANVARKTLCVGFKRVRHIYLQRKKILENSVTFKPWLQINSEASHSNYITMVCLVCFRANPFCVISLSWGGNESTDVCRAVTFSNMLSVLWQKFCLYAWVLL